MIAEVLKRKNLYKACRQVVRNKGSAGIDGMPVTELPAYLEANRDRIITSVLNHTYVPDAILGVAIPKGKGKTRTLGIPTVIDRWLQQAVSQVLISKFEAVRRCDRLRRSQLWLSPRKEYPSGSQTITEIHQRWLSGHCGHRFERIL